MLQKTALLTCVLTLYAPFMTLAQLSTSLKLNDVILLAQTKSIAKLTAETQKDNSYWNWRIFKSVTILS